MRCSNLADDRRDVFSSLPVTPPLWEHQRRMLDFLVTHKDVMFACDMGTGKSFAALAAIPLRHHRRVLIACPLSVVGSWQAQFARHAQFPYLLARLDQGSVAEKKAIAQGICAAAREQDRAAVVVINHESLWRPPFGEWALRARFDFGIIDESHRAKAYRGKLGRYLIPLSRTIPYRLLLTGTPFAHSPLSIFAQFRFLAPRVFGMRYTPFKERYAVLGGFQGKQIVGYQHLEELMEKFYTRAIVITKEDALPDLPPQLFVERTTTLAPAHVRQYRALEKTFYTQLETGEVTAANALVKLLRLQQFTSGYVTQDDGTEQWISDHKKTLLADTLCDLAPPIVVFARFTKDLDTIAAVAADLGLTYGEVSGRRKDLTSSATLRPETDVLGVNPQAGGTGVDLSRASTSIWYSLGFSLSDYEQALARLHRPGQQQHVTHIHLITEGTVDRHVRAALAARKEVIQWILDRR